MFFEVCYDCETTSTYIKFKLKINKLELEIPKNHLKPRTFPFLEKLEQINFPYHFPNANVICIVPCSQNWKNKILLKKLKTETVYIPCDE